MPSRSAFLLCCALFFNAAPSWPAVTANQHAEAVKQNNLGTALMNQQLLERAAAKFEEAYHLDPALALAEMNKGIALLYLQKLPEAKEALEKAAAQSPGDPHIWYALGLLDRSAAKDQQALESFQRASALDPSDADTHYFLGSLYTDLHEPEKALAEFKTALQLEPLHASAEFGMARVLQRSGKTVEAHAAFLRYQHMTQQKLSSPLAHSYGDEGRNSLVESVKTTDPNVGPMIPVMFAPETINAADVTHASVSDEPGGGACLIDLQNNGHLGLIVMGEGSDAIRAYQSRSSGSFEPLPASQTGLTASGTGVACAVGDFDNDGLPDLAVAMSDRVLLFKNTGGGKFTDVTKTAGIVAANHPAGLTFVDYDHDGDLDLFVTGKPGPGTTPNVVWRNNGNSTFTNWTGPTGLGGKGATASATLSDINNDRAVDLVVTGSGSAPTFFANPREGDFKASPLYATNLPPTTGVVAFDYNKDGWMDIAVTHSGAPGITLWRNIDGKRFARVALPIHDTTRGWGLTAIDFDNDGWIDLAVLVETKHGSELRVLRNEGAKEFVDVSAQLGLDKLKLHDPRAVLAADLDGDGDSDLIVTQLHGAPVILRNNGGNRNHSLRISLKGLADNKSAIGTKVEVFSNGMWQKWEVAGASGYLSQSSPVILAGLGKAEHADLVRLLWPTGVPQDETGVADKSSIAITELDRRGSSCPTLFAWNGKKYTFVTDVIGAGVVGHWVSPTHTNTPDPDEWVKVDGSQLKPRNGYLSLRFGEPMEEVNFLDQVRLMAIDHPAKTAVYPNERFLSEQPFAKQKTIVSAAAHPPAGAWDNEGHDVSPLLREVDRQYLHDFTNLSFAGFANPHTLTLDLGKWTPADPLRLLLHGYVEYFSASSMYAAWQAGIKPMPPYVEAQLPDGSWKRVISDMGFPAGLARTIVVDLTGKLPPGTRRIRLTTNLQIYWDQILVDNGPGLPGRIHQMELPLASADLAFRGYPEQIEGKSPGDLTYNYDHISQTGPFHRSRGSYTRYGTVTPLLKAIDNKFVIFGSGEDIDLEFNTASLPALPAGWQRDYFFYANGYVKDMDFYEASPFTVAAMPFHGMSGYPYPATEHYPNDLPRMNYQLEWNSRFDSGNDSEHYVFHYTPRTMQPPAMEPAKATP